MLPAGPRRSRELESSDINKSAWAASRGPLPAARVFLRRWGRWGDRPSSQSVSYPGSHPGSHPVCIPSPIPVPTPVPIPCVSRFSSWLPSRFPLDSQPVCIPVPTPAPIPRLSLFPPRLRLCHGPGPPGSSGPPGGARARSSRGGARIPIPRRGNVTSLPVAFAAAEEEEQRSGSDAMEAMPVPPASPAALVPAPAAGPVAVTGKEVVSPAARHPKKILDEEAYIEVRRRARVWGPPLAGAWAERF